MPNASIGSACGVTNSAVNIACGIPVNNNPIHCWRASDLYKVVSRAFVSRAFALTMTMIRGKGQQNKPHQIGKPPASGEKAISTWQLAAEQQITSKDISSHQWD